MKITISQLRTMVEEALLDEKKQEAQDKAIVLLEQLNDQGYAPAQHKLALISYWGDIPENLIVGINQKDTRFKDNSHRVINRDLLIAKINDLIISICIFSFCL